MAHRCDPRLKHTNKRCPGCAKRRCSWNCFCSPQVKDHKCKPEATHTGRQCYGCGRLRCDRRCQCAWYSKYVPPVQHDFESW